MTRLTLIATALSLCAGAALAENPIADHAELWDQQRAKSSAERAEKKAEVEKPKQAAQGAEAETADTDLATE
ncbi:MAG: hypothetical protein AAF501_03285 [Pseudomonadota bacterium]